MRGLVIGMHVTPARGYKEPTVTNRRTIRLLAQKSPRRLAGFQTAYGFMLQTSDSDHHATRCRSPALYSN